MGKDGMECGMTVRNQCFFFQIRKIFCAGISILWQSRSSDSWTIKSRYFIPTSVFAFDIPTNTARGYSSITQLMNSRTPTQRCLGNKSYMCVCVECQAGASHHYAPLRNTENVFRGMGLRGNNCFYRNNHNKMEIIHLSYS